MVMMKSLTRGLSGGPTLDCLDIDASWRNLDLEVIKELGEALKAQKQLSELHLNLFNNAIDNQGAEVLSSSTS